MEKTISMNTIMNKISNNMNEEEKKSKIATSVSPQRLIDIHVKKHLRL